jgi:hypothetical protein
VENGDKNIHANHDDLPSSDDPLCGFKGRQWFAISAMMLIVVAVAVTLALMLPPEPTPPLNPVTDLLSSAASGWGVALADPSMPQSMVIKWLAGNPNLANHDTSTVQEVIQRMPY